MKKKDGWRRWVTDLRELNKQRIKDSCPLTNIQEILHSLRGATVFFLSLDACRSYHAVRIQAGSRVCTPLSAPSAHSNIYIHMRFGLASAGSVHSRMLYIAMKKVDQDFWTSYLDNILTYGREPWATF